MENFQEPFASNDGVNEEDGHPSDFFWRTIFTAVALILVALLFCCIGKRRRLQPEGHSDSVLLLKKHKQTDNETVGIADGDFRLQTTDNAYKASSASRKEDSRQANHEDESACRSVASVDAKIDTDHSSIENSNDDDMEIIGSRHRTTIEIKHFKTAVLPSKIDQPVTSEWHGTVFHKDKNIHDQELSIGCLEIERSNLIDDNDYSAGYRSLDHESIRDDLSDFAIVQVTVGQQTVDTYAIDQSNDKMIDNLHSDEHGDFVDENVTWRTKTESDSDRQRTSMEKRTSVFEVIGAKDVGEILEKVETLENVTDIVRLAGLESGQLIFGIDYTASNRNQGTISFDGESLHSIIHGKPNPYQQVINVMGKTLAPLARGGCIPAYGFGDIRTSDTSIFPLKEGGHCVSFDEVLEVYNRITPRIILSGPTNFAPLIYQAIEICKEFKRYHILVIVADGQVTNEADTRNAIVDACAYPLSIIVVGVGDGPWDMMRVFDEKLPRRIWDNFHFVEFYKVTHGAKQPELAFAVQALLEIPDQYKEIKALGLLNFR